MLRSLFLKNLLASAVYKSTGCVCESETKFKVVHLHEKCNFLSPFVLLESRIYVRSESHFHFSIVLRHDAWSNILLKFQKKIPRTLDFIAIKSLRQFCLTFACATRRSCKTVLIFGQELVNTTN